MYQVLNLLDLVGWWINSVYQGDRTGRFACWKKNNMTKQKQMEKTLQAKLDAALDLLNELKSDLWTEDGYYIAG